MRITNPGPYADPRPDGTHRLTPAGRDMLAAYLTRYPNPVAGVRSLYPADYASARRVGLTDEDIGAAACAGLVRAVLSFDPARGLKLSTYLAPWMRSYVQHATRAELLATRRVNVRPDGAVGGRGGDGWDELPVRGDPDPVPAGLVRGEELAAVARGLPALPTADRRVLAAYYGPDASPAGVRAVARELRVRVRDVDWLRDRAVRRLKAELGVEG